ALQEIKYYQRTTGLLLLPTPFRRLCREVAQDGCGDNTDHRWRPQALDALQNGAEDFLVSILSASNVAAIHARRVTIQPKDMMLACRLTDMMGDWLKIVRTICRERS
ncbi:histone-fold-containing protein, partial [Clathrospora elynae]